jgi:hypothetical protein
MAESAGIGRRRAVAGVGAAGALLLGGCDRIEGSGAVRESVQRLGG